MAEEAKKPMVPGVGIAPTFTISRAVLSDAVALVRGDRFYTVSRLILVSVLCARSCSADRLSPQKPDQLGLRRSTIRLEHQSRLVSDCYAA